MKNKGWISWPSEQADKRHRILLPNSTVKFLNFGMPEIFAVSTSYTNKEATPKGHFVKMVQME